MLTDSLKHWGGGYFLLQFGKELVYVRPHPKILQEIELEDDG